MYRFWLPRQLFCKQLRYVVEKERAFSDVFIELSPVNSFFVRLQLVLFVLFLPSLFFFFLFLGEGGVYVCSLVCSKKKKENREDKRAAERDLKLHFLIRSSPLRIFSKVDRTDLSA